jgi:hypothetical protein
MAEHEPFGRRQARGHLLHLQLHVAEASGGGHAHEILGGRHLARCTEA